MLNLQDLSSQDKKFLDQNGLELTMVENLLAARPSWERAVQKKLSLEWVYALEVDPSPSDEDEDEDEKNQAT